MSEKYVGKIIARSAAIASRMLGGEMMIMSAVDSTFFTLNPVATVIWQAADGSPPLSEIVTRHVCGEFQVDFETAYRDAEQFVEELSGHGILLISELPSFILHASKRGGMTLRQASSFLRGLVQRSCHFQR